MAPFKLSPHKMLAIALSMKQQHTTVCLLEPEKWKRFYCSVSQAAIKQSLRLCHRSEQTHGSVLVMCRKTWTWLMLWRTYSHLQSLRKTQHIPVAMVTRLWRQQPGPGKSSRKLHGRNQLLQPLYKLVFSAFLYIWWWTSPHWISTINQGTSLVS